MSNLKKYLQLIEELEKPKQHKFRKNDLFKKQKSIQEKIEQIKLQKAEEEISNLRNDRKLKNITLIALFILLIIETILIFTIAFFQGFKFCGFLIDEVTLRIIIAATITQITIMIHTAVKHLFPHT